MNTLITREIDPRIEKINKILVFSTPLFLLLFYDAFYIFSPIFFLTLALVFLYEINIYKRNEEFISIFEKDKYHFTYMLIMKYYKVVLLLIGFMILRVAVDHPVENLMFSVLYILLGMAFITELTIVKTNIFKLLLKYFIVSAITLFLFSNIYYTFYGSYVIRSIGGVVISMQLIYLIISLNIYHMSKSDNKKSGYLNDDLMISVFLIILLEIIMSKTFYIRIFSAKIIFSAIIYPIAIFIILNLNDGLKKKFKVKPTRYNKIVNIYAVLIILIAPLAIIFMFLMDTLRSRMFDPLYILFFVGYFSYLELVGVVLLAYYKSKSKKFKGDLIEKASGIYDSWY